ncbi:MAG: phosphoribosylglycinamide formyltransferase [Gammaproteobacteria bacterium]
MNNFKLIILISGNGSTLQAIINAIKHQQLHAEISAVISNRADAYGLERAQQANIPTQVISHKDYPTREQFDQALQKTIDAYAPNLVVLAGFMRILTPKFVTHYLGRLINIHPSLLPAYRGTHTYERALAANEQQHGTSVHYVTEELDGGPLIAQTSLPILPEDTAETLRVRTQQLEHRFYPQVIEWIATQQVSWCDGKVLWLNKGN